MLARMEPRSAEVLRLRFGLDGDPLTLEQIAQRFSVTRERIRQIEAKALDKIRSGHLRKSLEGFVD
jgi:RNA polymerase primary sigma factor